MARHKLALIGRNIAHSKSPEIYSKLLENNVDYHLLDYPSVDQIPSLDYFSKNFEGISITSPYKEVFINDVELVGKAKELKAIPLDSSNLSIARIKPIQPTCNKSS